MSKTILITGATSGFGKAIAHRFAKEGYTICITGRRTDRLKEISQELKDLYGVMVKGLAFDVRVRTQVEAAIAKLKTLVPAIDILVNNAGLAAGLSNIACIR